MATTTSQLSKGFDLTRLSPVTSSVGVMWIAAAAIAVCSPDMLTGAFHEHLPIGAITIWFYVGLATAFVLTAAAARPQASAASGASAWWVSIIWISVAVASVFGPMMVTGSDPTEIPIAVFIAPVVGMVATGFVAILEAAGRFGREA